MKALNPTSEERQKRSHGHNPGHEHGHSHGHDGCGHEHGHNHGHDGCGCGHEHGHSHEHTHENCGHEHGHSHGHDGCGHEHGYRQEDIPTRSHTHFVEEHRHTPGHPESCSCPECHPHVEYCDICSESLAKCTCRMPDEGLEKRVYILEGIDCANCAAKIESKIRQMPEVAYASVTFATKQLRVSANNQDELMPKMQALIDAIEDGVTLVPRKKQRKDTEKKDGISEEKRSMYSILIGAALFLTGEVLEHIGAPMPAGLAVLAVAYLLLGGKVLLTAARNIAKGQLFDENFLMGIATLGAFAIREYPEAVGVMLFYRIGEYFEGQAVAQSRKQIMDAIDLRPEVVNLVIGEDIRTIDAEEANVGDILMVRPGDRIPLDGVILKGESRIDTSPVTGEPVPVKASIGDNITSGCVNTSGQLLMRVEKTLEESMVTKILDSVENAAATKPEIDKFITRFARVYTPLVVLAAAIVALALPFILPNWHFFVDPQYTGTVNAIHGTTGTASILTALTFLVISCPCALVLSVPLAFFSGIGAASKKGILFKGGNVIESLSGIQAVVMDKTGTITKGNFVVQQAVPAIQGLKPEELLSISASCESFSSHPIGSSILAAAKEWGLEVERPAEVSESAGQGIRAVTSKGIILCGNRKLMDANNVDLAGYRNDSFGTEVLTAIDGIFAGHILISDTIKEDAVSAIARTKKMGVLTAMLTGDAQESAENVAQKTGIDEVHAKLLPEDKLAELQTIRSNHGRVMFVGDGINDAPVLAGADVGAAMGSGADAAIEAADVVFMNSEMSSIPLGIEIAKATKKISWQNVYFALTVKFVVMVFGLFGFANMWAAVFADTGVSLLCLLNSIRILRWK